MKRLFGAGLVVLTGCLALPAPAEEIQWRPAKQPASTTTSSSNAGPTAQTVPGLSLGRPSPISPAQPATTAVLPTSCSEGASAQPIVRAQGDDGKSQPAPVQLVQGAILTPPAGVPLDGVPGPGYPGAGGPDYPVPVYPGESVVLPPATNPGPWSRPLAASTPLAIPHFYFRAEYLLWSLGRDSTPPLVTGTVAPAAALIASGNPGALGNPLTGEVIGGGVDNPAFSGGRFTIGGGNFVGLGFGVEATYFFLAQGGSSAFAGSNAAGQPGLYSPVFLGTTPAAAVIAFPGLVQGAVEVDHSTRLWGLETNLRKTLISTCNSRLDVLAGLRYVELSENLTITRESTILPVPGIAVLPGGPFVSADSFGTRNRFYGGQLGLDYQYRAGHWIFGAAAKVALGDMNQTVQQSGGSTGILGIAAPAGPNTGLLVQGTNSGRFSQDRFAVIPEAGLKIGYQITDNLSVFVGYDVMYLSNVVRPGGQVDLTLNAPAGRPAVLFNSSHLWAQGANVGLEFRY